MLRGDISNHRSLLFGFRFENSLVQIKDRGLLDRVLNAVMGKYSRADMNEEVLSAMNYLYWNTEYTVALVVDDQLYDQSTKDFISELPFNQVFNVRSISQVTMMLNTGEMSYYVDECEKTRYAAQSKYAMTVREFNTLLRRHYGRLT